MLLNFSNDNDDIGNSNAPRGNLAKKNVQGGKIRKGKKFKTENDNNDEEMDGEGARSQRRGKRGKENAKDRRKAALKEYLPKLKRTLTEFMRARVCVRVCACVVQKLLATTSEGF